ncbi:MAG: DUF1800 domain-containing protein [Acidimicrobiia bacterium]|nr:DUF1800 domain-containing protein [Acidimicrobiia bacterium]
MEEALEPGQLREGISFWVDAMASGTRLIEERLTWFWHDHFATNVRKVRFPYLMWTQHLTLRRHASGSFADLLQAMAVDPAMLFYLDGAQNRAGQINENFGREVMELYTLGVGSYTEDDVVDAARAFSGWVVAVPRPDRPMRIPADPWTAFFVPFRHDSGSKTLLGVSGAFDAGDAIDILLDQPSTAEFVATKLYQHLTGLSPAPALQADLGRVFRADYAVMDLVEAIVSDPGFLSEASIRSKVRTPLEKAVTLLQAYPVHDRAEEWLAMTLDTAQYLPFLPPNPAGFPDGPRLLDPFRLVHGLDFAGVVDPRALQPLDPGALFERLGVFDLSGATGDVIAAEADPFHRLALAVGSPEFALT